jgi:hypothetical protein
MRIEVEVCWTRDATGRLVASRVPEGAWAAPALLVASSGDDYAAYLSADLPSEIAGAVGGVDARTGTPVNAIEMQSRVERIVGPCTVGGGPSYVVPNGTTFPADTAIETSHAADAEALRGRMPDEDVDGTYGPWAIAVVDDEVAAMCCTVREHDGAVEAGLWTYAPFRGRGLAAAVTAAWASLHAPHVICFYSTAYTNASSQRVTQRLALPQIGWTWQLIVTRDP